MRQSVRWAEAWGLAGAAACCPLQLLPAAVATAAAATACVLLSDWADPPPPPPSAHLRYSSSSVWLRRLLSFMEYLSLQMAMMGTRVLWMVCRQRKRRRGRGRSTRAEAACGKRSSVVLHLGRMA